MLLNFTILITHIILNFLLGNILYSATQKSPQKLNTETTIYYILIGIFLETMITFLLIQIGIPHTNILILLASFTIITSIIFSIQKKLTLPQNPVATLRHHVAKNKSKNNLPLTRGIKGVYWYEIALLILILVHATFIYWQITHTNLFFYDALNHWGGRTKDLFFQTNWSWNPQDFTFLGINGSDHYPLQSHLWRLHNMLPQNQWNEWFIRIDGLLIWLLTITLLWSSTFRITKKRSLAALAGFLFATLPLGTWHALAGYVDIQVGLFALAATTALLRKEYFIAGLLATAGAWTKNDGLILFLPPLLFLCIMLQIPHLQKFIKSPINSLKTLKIQSHLPPDKGARGFKNILHFLAGVACLLPWTIFNITHQLGITPSGDKIVLHPDAPLLFWNYVILGPTDGIFWLCTFIILIWTTPLLLKDKKGFPLLLFFLSILAIIAIIFGATDSYQWLLQQTTIHRTMLQFSPITILLITYAISLKLSTNKTHECK